MTHCLLHSSPWSCKLRVAAAFHKSENWGSESCALPAAMQVITASGAEVGSSCSLTPESLFFPTHLPVSSTPYMPHIFHFWFKWGAIISLKEIQPWTMGATRRHWAALWETLWCCLSQTIRAAWHIVCPATSTECCNTRSGDVGPGPRSQGYSPDFGFSLLTCNPGYTGTQPTRPQLCCPQSPDPLSLPSLWEVTTECCRLTALPTVDLWEPSPAMSLKARLNFVPVLIVRNSRVSRISFPGYPTLIIR